MRFNGLLLAALVLSCTNGGTVLRVDVRTDWVPTVEFAEVEVTLDDRVVTYPAAFTDDFLTGMRVATLEGVPTGSRRVRARLLAADGRRVAERLVAVDVDGPRTVTLVFTRNCDAVECPGSSDSANATECNDGRCVSPECSPENPEACPTTCTVDGDCPTPAVGCARSICTAGSCFVGSDVAACATSEYCNPELGCVPRPGTGDMGVPVDMGMPADMGEPEECGQPCDTGDDCEVGVFDCSSGAPVCVRDRLVDSGVTCRPATGPCDVEEVCDGSSPACPIDGFAPTGTTCAAGFCDGFGSCSAGCTPGAACSTGDPCATGTISCDTGAPVCVRSGNAADGTVCAATENGSWGSCGGYSGVCDETGTRSRTVTSYACQSGSCAPSTSMDTEACGRDTDGGSCGSVSYGGWGSCGGFSGTCDETGTRSRTVTTPTCVAGSCSNVTSSENGPCTRSTDGTSCGSVSYGSWGSCGGFTSTCDETGTESRTVTTPLCSSGSCTGSMSSENRPCTRDTDGMSCGASPFPCQVRVCQSASCQSFDTCGAFEHCCEFGCRPNGTLCD